MSAQAGKDLLVKLDDGTGNFITVAGLRTRQLTFNANVIDITDQDSAGRWRELLSGGGVRHATVSGSGIFRDANSDLALKKLFFDSTVANVQLVIPAFGLVQGAFLFASLVYKADYGASVEFDIALESAGLITFTAI